MAKETNPVVTIATSLAGMFIAVTALVVIFAREYTWVLAWIIFGFVMLAAVMGKYATRKK